MNHLWFSSVIFLGTWTSIMTSFKSEGTSLVENFQCESLENRDLTCTWEMKIPDPDALFNVSCTVDPGCEDHCNESSEPSPESKIYFGYLCRRREYKFWLDVTINGSIHGNTYIHSIFTNNSIVRPDKPEIEKIIHLNSTHLQLKWTVDDSICNGLLYSCKYTVNYTSEYDGDHSEHTTMDTYVLNLIPSFTYNIFIYACLTDSNLWSGALFLRETMAEDKPVEGPEIPKGSFKVTACEQQTCNISIMWKPIPFHLKHGNITHYEVNVSGETSSVIISGDDQHYVELSAMHTDTPYNISITASTAVGASPPTHSTMVLLPTSMNKTKDVIIEEDHIYSKLYIQWMAFNDDDVYYMLFWCPHQDFEEIHCTGDLNAIEILGNGTNYVLSQDFGEESSHAYAMSTNEVDGYASSGMHKQWLCAYNYHGSPATPSLEFPDDQMERSMVLVIIPVDCYHSNASYAWNFSVQVYCCESALPELWQDIVWDEMVDRTNLSVTIVDLEPYTRYQVTVQAFSHEDSSEPAVEVFHTLQSRPDDPPHRLMLTAVTSDVVNISWAPPTKPNGIIDRHIIYIYVQDDIFNTSNIIFENNSASLRDLHGFVTYNMSVQAVNMAGSSPLSEWINFTTLMREPSQMDSPNTAVSEDEDAATVAVTWSRPDPPHGPVSSYLVNLTWGPDPHQNRERNISGELNFMEEQILCDDRRALSVGVTILAVNSDENNEFIGPPSPESYVEICSEPGPPLPEWIIALISVFGVIVILIIVAGIWFGAFKTHSWYTKEIPIEIPADGEGYEEVPDDSSRENYHNTFFGDLPQMNNSRVCNGHIPPDYNSGDNEEICQKDRMVNGNINGKLHDDSGGYECMTDTRAFCQNLGTQRTNSKDSGVETGGETSSYPAPNIEIDPKTLLSEDDTPHKNVAGDATTGKFNTEEETENIRDTSTENISNISPEGTCCDYVDHHSSTDEYSVVGVNLKDSHEYPHTVHISPQVFLNDASNSQSGQQYESSSDVSRDNEGYRGDDNDVLHEDDTIDESYVLQTINSTHIHQVDNYGYCGDDNDVSQTTCSSDMHGKDTIRISPQDIPNDASNSQRGQLYESSSDVSWDKEDYRGDDNDVLHEDDTIDDSYVLQTICSTNTYQVDNYGYCGDDNDVSQTTCSADMHGKDNCERPSGLNDVLQATCPPTTFCEESKEYLGDDVLYMSNFPNLDEEETEL